MSPLLDLTALSPLPPTPEISMTASVSLEVDDRSFSGLPSTFQSTAAVSPPDRPIPAKRQKTRHMDTPEPEPAPEQTGPTQATAVSPPIRSTPAKRQKKHHQQEPEPEPDPVEWETYAAYEKSKYDGPKFKMSSGVVYEQDCTIHHVRANGNEYIIESEKILPSDKRPTIDELYCSYISEPTDEELWAKNYSTWKEKKTAMHKNDKSLFIQLTRQPG